MGLPRAAILLELGYAACNAVEFKLAAGGAIGGGIHPHCIREVATSIIDL